MGKGKRSGKSWRARISVAATSTTMTASSMPSQSVPSIDISHYDNSTAPSDHGELSIGPLDHPLPESVPSLDRDLSTDLASDYLSSAEDSFLGADDDDSVVEPEVEMGAVPADAASVYAPSRYPAVPAAYRTEALDGDDETIGSTRSLNPLDLQYVFENGRRYCGSYFMPNDDDEQIRLHLQHQVFLRTFDGRLTCVSLEDPTHILDIGTGVGDWAMGIATMYPDCDVVGTDISNIFAREAPINCNWEVDDAELEWHRPPDYYDLIHLRAMAGAFKDWNHIYKSAFTCLKPGGWLEILDFHDHRGEGQFFSFFDPNSIILKLDRDFREASIMSGRPRNMDHLEPRLLVNLGYTDVQCTEHAIPFRTEDGELGKLWLVTVLEALEANGIRLLTKYKGWDPEEVRRGCWQIGQEMLKLARSPKKGKDFVMKIRILKGRKPGDYENWSTIPASETASETDSITADMSGNSGDRDSYMDVESGYVSNEQWTSYPMMDAASAMNSELHRRLVEYDRSVALSSSGIFGVENKAASHDGNMDLSSDQPPQPSQTLDPNGINGEANDEVARGPEANAPRGAIPRHWTKYT